MKQILFLIAIIATGFTACKQCETRLCDINENLNLKMVNYSVGDADSFRVRMSYQGSNFNWFVDSILLFPSRIEADTIYLDEVNRTSRPMYSSNSNYNYDLEIENLSDHKRIRISNLVNEQGFVEYCHSPFINTKEKVYCTNKLTSFNYSISSGGIDAFGNTILIYK